MYDQHIRTQLARERAADLRLDWPITATPAHRFRLALALGLIRAGARLAPESAGPRPELSSRA